MAFDEHLADRIRLQLKERNVFFEEKKMMGGLTYMVNDKMCVGIHKDILMARIGPDLYEEALTKKGCREMDFTKRPMKGFVFVDPEGIDLEDELSYWLDLALAYNKIVPTSKKKKKKKK